MKVPPDRKCVYRFSEHGDVETCHACGAEAPLLLFGWHGHECAVAGDEPPPRFAGQEWNMLCALCADGLWATPVVCYPSQVREADRAAAMMAKMANAMLDTLTDRRSALPD